MKKSNLPDENITNTEDVLPENVKNLLSARIFKELTEDEQNEKEREKYENKN